jgi:hypothetical protein
MDRIPLPPGDSAFAKVAPVCLSLRRSAKKPKFADSSMATLQSWENREKQAGSFRCRDARMAKIGKAVFRSTGPSYLCRLSDSGDKYARSSAYLLRMWLNSVYPRI